jgi:hypothetical protein
MERPMGLGTTTFIATPREFFPAAGLALVLITGPAVAADDPAAAGAAARVPAAQPAADPPFALLDANADGRISADEALGNASPGRFRGLDLDQDGSVSVDEYSGVGHA